MMMRICNDDWSFDLRKQKHGKRIISLQATTKKDT